MVTITWADEFYGILDDLDSRPELMLITDSQDVQAIKEYLGSGEWLDDYDSFMVEVLDGDYGDIFGFSGIIPYSSYPVYRIYQKKVSE